MRILVLFMLVSAVLLSGCIEPKGQTAENTNANKVKYFQVVYLNNTSFTYYNDVFNQYITLNRSQFRTNITSNITAFVDECYENSVACPVLYINRDYYEI